MYNQNRSSRLVKQQALPSHLIRLNSSILALEERRKKKKNMKKAFVLSRAFFRCARKFLIRSSSSLPLVRLIK